jgi:glutamate-5-semialdehyde dehydrogenase
MNAAMNTVPEPSAELLARAGAVRLAAVELGQTNNGQRSRALHAMADALQERSSLIVAANVQDLERSEAEGLASALMARLKLDVTKLQAAIDGVRLAFANSTGSSILIWC